MARTKASVSSAKQTTTKRSRSDSEIVNSELANLKSPRMEIPVHKPMGEKQINSLSSALRDLPRSDVGKAMRARIDALEAKEKEEEITVEQLFSDARARLEKADKEREEREAEVQKAKHVTFLTLETEVQKEKEKTIREVIDSSDEEEIQTKVSELKLLRQQTILQQDMDPIFELFWKEKCLPFGWKHEVHDGINVYIRPNAKYIGGERNKDYFFDTRLIMVAVEFANYPPGFIQNIVEPTPVVPVAPVTTVVKTYSKVEPKEEPKEDPKEDNASDVGDHMAVSSVSSDSPKPVVAQASQVVQVATAQASQATLLVPLPKMDLKDVSFSQILPKKKISSVLRETWFRQHKIELNYHISIVPPSEQPPADKPVDAPWVKFYIITITDDDMNTLGAHVVCGKKQVHTLKLKINTVPFHPSQPKTPILGVFFKLLADFRFVASLFLINQV
jgi:hypothetical protein